MKACLQWLIHFNLQLYEKEGHYLGAEHSQHGTVGKVQHGLPIEMLCA